MSRGPGLRRRPCPNKRGRAVLLRFGTVARGSAPKCEQNCLARLGSDGKLAQERDDIKICKLNIDEYQVQATKMTVMSIPTLMVFDQGEKLGQHVGALSKADLIGFINASMGK